MGKYEAPRKKLFQKERRTPPFFSAAEECREDETELEIENDGTVPVTDNELPIFESDIQEEATDLEEDADEEAPDSGADSPEDDAADKKRKLILISVCAGLLTLLIGLIVGIIIFAGRDSDDGLILDNVYAGDVNLGGLTVEEAKGALHLATDRTYSVKDMVVYLSEEMSFSLSPKDTGAELNVDAVVQAAYKHGREGSDADYQKAKKEAATTSYTVPLLPYLSLDLDYIRQATEDYCASVYSVLSDPEITLKGDRPTYDPDKPNASVSHQTLSITLGTPDFQVDTVDLYDRILDAYSMNLLELEYDAPEMVLPTAVTAENLFQQYCLAPQDAFLDAESYKIISESYGYGFDKAVVQKQLDAAPYGDKLEITLSFLEPQVFASDLTEKLYVDTLSQAQTSSDINDADRNHNLKLACQAIDKKVIKAGESFSLNQLLGKLSKNNGYKEAAISQYNGTVIGGGVSQVASALYCSALQANLEVTERHCHEYAVDFIDMGLDAFVDGKDHDLRIRNTGKSPVRISATVENHTVRIDLHGINTLEHKIELRTSVVSVLEQQTVYTDIDANNASEYQDGDVLEDGVPGYKIAVYREKHDPANNELVSSKQVSTSEYKSVDRVAVRIVYTDPEPGTTPVPEAPIPTESIEYPELTGPMVPLG